MVVGVFGQQMPAEHGEFAGHSDCCDLVATSSSDTQEERTQWAWCLRGNAIEALNSKLRRAVRTRGHFPSDDAATKLLYLVLNRATAEWKRPPREWAEAKTQFAVMFNERFVNS